MELAIAVLGVMLGAASLTWQYATHVLTGGRVKVVLRVGARNDRFTTMLTVRPNKVSPTLLENWSMQGFTQQRLEIEVRSIGRMPVTVTRWQLVSPDGAIYRPTVDVSGPRLPHQIGAGGAPGIWEIDLERAFGLAKTSKTRWAERPDSTAAGIRGVVARARFELRRRRGVMVIVELGDGRQIASRKDLPA